MTSKSSKRRCFALALATGGVVLGWLVLDFLPIGRGVVARIDRLIHDEVLRLSGGPPERQDLVLLGIDEASLDLQGLSEEEIAASPALERMSQRFPWDRRVWADVVDRLADAGARLIVIDLVFSSPSDPEADAALAKAIRRHPGKVVLTSLFAPVGQGDEGREVFTLIEPIEELWDAEVGFANLPIDSRDGLRRRARYTSTLGWENGMELEGEEVQYSLAARMIQELGGEVPRGERELRFSTMAEQGGGGVYAPISLYGIFAAEEWTRNFDSGRFFEGKVVLIGPVAARFQDVHPTPVGAISGPQLHLQAVGCGMAGAFMAPAVGAGWWMLGVGMLAALWASLVPRTLVASVGVILMLLGLAFTVVLGVVKGSVLIPVTGAAVAVLAAWLTAQSFHLLSSRLERRRLRSQFRRFVSRDVADRLVDEPELWEKLVIGRLRRVVVLFSDVRGFTERAQLDDPAALVGQLNEYLTAMVAIVFRHGGTLDKFIGDAVMAHWGALGGDDEQAYARAALATAREMHEEVHRLNQGWAERGMRPMQIGIGLHLGDVIAGELGSPERIEFGVIGDAVNVASRLEGLTKFFKAETIYSADLRDAAGDTAGFSIGQVRVVGRSEALRIHADGDAAQVEEASARLPKDSEGVIELSAK